MAVKCSCVSVSSTHLSFSMLALNLHIIISHLHLELLRREVFHIQVDRESIPVGSHLQKVLTAAIGTVVRPTKTLNVKLLMY